MLLGIFRKFSIISMFWTIVLFITVTIIAFFFQELASDPTLNIAMLYTLGAFITARYTEGYLYGFIYTLASVFSVNYFFTYPYGLVNFTMRGYYVTFIGMFVIGIITSILSTNIKEQSIVLLNQEKALAKKEKQILEIQKEKMRANLLRAVSHDLRTPLTGIIGNSLSYLDMEEELSSQEKRELIENINTDASWLLNMVENLLSVTRIDNVTAQVNKTLEAVDEVISAAVIKFKKHFPEAKVKVSVPDDLIMAMMDAMLIQQVILNILQNAYIHSKSTKPLELTVNVDEDNIWFKIKDYGIGISEDRLLNIFDGTGKRKEKEQLDGHKGMGIGLSICKTIISAHSGKITAQNHSEGAEFIFSLPKEKEEK